MESLPEGNPGAAPSLPALRARKAPPRGGGASANERMSRALAHSPFLTPPTGDGALGAAHCAKEKTDGPRARQSPNGMVAAVAAASEEATPRVSLP